MRHLHRPSRRANQKPRPRACPDCKSEPLGFSFGFPFDFAQGIAQDRARDKLCRRAGLPSALFDGEHDSPRQPVTQERKCTATTLAKVPTLQTFARVKALHLGSSRPDSHARCLVLVPLGLVALAWFIVRRLRRRRASQVSR